MILFTTLICGAKDALLESLDKALSGDYIFHRINTLDSLRRLAESSGKYRWHRYHELASRYSDFDVDSALYYNDLARKNATADSQLTRTNLQLASLYNSSLMMYKEAFDIFSSINIVASDTTLKKDYFVLGVQLYRNLEGLAPDETMKARYAGVKRAFRDSVMKYSPDEKFIRANELLDKGQPGMALNLFASDLHASDDRKDNGAVYHIISRAYSQLGNPDKEIEYLAKAARADIENGVREYLALPQLALRLYERGDVNRAYRYMRRSIEDAKACKARVRLFDMTETISVISETYAAQQRDVRMKLGIALGLVGVMLILAVITIYYARQRNKLLNLARAKLEDSNHRLETAGNIREKNVRQFMNLSRDYLEKLDKYRAGLFKIASKRNFDALFNAIKSSELTDTASATFFSNFDKAFLELYPDFIDEFNSLLLPEENIKLSEPDTLNTELRIFALMKLGVTESTEIARFLHCSQSTVYNYRTRYRAKAINKEEFVNHFFNKPT